MTIRIDRFNAADLAQIDVQDAQLSILPLIDALGEDYERGGPACTLRHDGRVAACAGLLWTTLGAHAWAVVGRSPPFVALHRLALRAFSVYCGVRVTATCETGFDAGCRWLEMLGFEAVEVARAAGVDGADHFIYVREAQ